MELNNLFEMILKLILVIFLILGLFSIYLQLMNRYKKRTFEKNQIKVRNSRFLADNLALAPISKDDTNSFHIVKKQVTTKTFESNTTSIKNHSRIQVLNNNYYSVNNTMIKTPYYQG